MNKRILKTITIMLCFVLMFTTTYFSAATHDNEQLIKTLLESASSDDHI